MDDPLREVIEETNALVVQVPDDRLLITRVLTDEESVQAITLIMACMGYQAFIDMCKDMGDIEPEKMHKWVSKHARRSDNEDREPDSSGSETSEIHVGGTSSCSINGDLLGSKDTEPLD